MADSMDVLIRMVAEDKASAAVNKVDKSLDKLDANAKKASRGITNFGDASKNTARGLGNLNTAITGAATAFAGMLVFQKTAEMLQHGEEVRTVTNTYNALTGSAQQADRTLQSLRQRTRGMISDTQLMAAANDLLGGNIAKSSDEAVRLIGLANDLGASTEQLFSVLANQSIEVLDSFKVSSGAVRQLRQDFIDAGMASDEAFKEAFLIEADKAVERLGDSIEQNVSPTEQLIVRWQNFFDDFAMMGRQAVDNALIRLDELGFIIQYAAGTTTPQVEYARSVAGLTEGVTPFQQLYSQGEAMANLRGAGWDPRMALAQYTGFVPGGGFGGGGTAGAAREFQAGRIGERLGGDIRGAAEAFNELIESGKEGFTEFRDDFIESRQDEIAAIEESTAAYAELIAELEALSARIGGAVQGLLEDLGYVTPEQEVLDAVLATVESVAQRQPEARAELYERAGMLERGELGLTDVELQDPQAILRALYINEPTPLAGDDARFVGDQIAAMQQMYQMGTAGVLGGVQAQFAGTPVQTRPWLRGAPEQPGYNPLAGVWGFTPGMTHVPPPQPGYNPLAGPYAGTPAPPNMFAAAGQELVSMAAGVAAAVIAEGQLGAALADAQRQPGYVQPFAPAAQQAPAPITGLFGSQSGYELFMHSLQPESPAVFGAADYSNMPQYGADAEQTNSYVQLLQQGLDMVTGSVASIADEEHMGAWDDRVSEATSEVDRMRLAVDNLVGRRRTLDIDVRLNQNAFDSLTNAIFSIIRSSGINLGSRQGGSGRPF